MPARRNCSRRWVLRRPRLPAWACATRWASLTRRARSAAPSFSRTAVSSPKLPTCRSNADLENGYADDPQEAATILRDAAEMGVVGGSIEDWSGERIYDFHHAVERVAAGVEMARRLPVPFTFVARAENLIRGRPDLDDTIKRLQAFERAGADVLYAPGLRDLETMRTVVQAVGKPLNVVMSAADPALTAAEMEAVGVKRLSFRGALSRLAPAAFMKGAREMKEQGAFPWVRDAMPTTDLKAVFGA